MAAHIHLLIGAEDRLLKFEMQVFAQSAPRWARLRRRPALAEQVAKTKNVPENVAEVLEDGGIESGWTSGAAAHARMPETVIQRPLLAIREDCVGFRDLLELVFRLRIIRIASG